MCKSIIEDYQRHFNLKIVVYIQGENGLDPQESSLFSLTQLSALFIFYHTTYCTLPCET